MIKEARQYLINEFAKVCRENNLSNELYFDGESFLFTNKLPNGYFGKIRTKFKNLLGSDKYNYGFGWVGKDLICEYDEIMYSYDSKTGKEYFNKEYLSEN